MRRVPSSMRTPEAMGAMGGRSRAGERGRLRNGFPDAGGPYLMRWGRGFPGERGRPGPSGGTVLALLKIRLEERVM